MQILCFCYNDFKYVNKVNICCCFVNSFRRSSNYFKRNSNEQNPYEEKLETQIYKIVNAHFFIPVTVIFLK